jgi:predicted DNA-binding transcriptional regulator AlpA
MSGTASHPSSPGVATDTLLRAADVARLLSVSVRTVWRMRDAGQLPRPVRVASKMVRWRRSDIESFIQNGLPDG